MGVRVSTPAGGVAGDRDGDLEIRLLGAGSVRRGGEPVEALSAPRVLALLARLAMAGGQPVDRSTLAYGLWPDSTDPQSKTNLRHLVHSVRRGLPDHERWLEITPRTLAWIGDPSGIDLMRFLAADDAGEVDVAAAAYGGDLLPGHWEQWILDERDRLRTRGVAVMAAAAEAAEDADDIEPGLQWSERLLEIEPGHEPSYRRIMRLHVLAGDRARALHTFHRCTTRLADDLGVPPDPQTRSLYESIRRSAEPAGDDAALAQLIGRDSEFATLDRAWNERRPGWSPRRRRRR